MGRLDRITNIAIICTCCAIAGDIVYRHVAPAAIADANRMPARPRPPEYQPGDVLEPIAGLTPDTSRPSLLLVVKSGCRFCESSVPFYRQLVDRVRSSASPVGLVGVCLEPSDACASYFKAKGIAVDRTIGVEPGSLKVAGTPTLILVDAGRKVQSTWIGALPEAKQRSLLDTLSGSSGN
jgi:hypothetical protein